MAVKNLKNDERKVISFCNQQYLISNIRRVKILRELSEGTQRRLIEWD